MHLKYSGCCILEEKEINIGGASYGWAP